MKSRDVLYIFESFEKLNQELQLGDGVDNEVKRKKRKIEIENECMSLSEWKKIILKKNTEFAIKQ